MQNYNRISFYFEILSFIASQISLCNISECNKNNLEITKANLIWQISYNNKNMNL